MVYPKHGARCLFPRGSHVGQAEFELLILLLSAGFIGICYSTLLTMKDLPAIRIFICCPFSFFIPQILIMHLGEELAVLGRRHRMKRSSRPRLCRPVVMRALGKCGKTRKEAWTEAGSTVRAPGPCWGKPLWPDTGAGFTGAVREHWRAGGRRAVGCKMGAV